MGLSCKSRAISGVWSLAKETYSCRTPDEVQILQLNGTEGCATEVAQTQEDRGRSVRGEEKDLDREKGRESTEKKKWEERRRGETPWRKEDVSVIAETASRKT